MATQTRTRRTRKNLTPGQTIRAARKNAGMTQVELSEATGLTQGYISSLETGRADVSHRAAWILATALNIAPETLMPKAVRARLQMTSWAHAAW